MFCSLVVLLYFLRKRGSTESARAWTCRCVRQSATVVMDACSALEHGFFATVESASNPKASGYETNSLTSDGLQTHAQHSPPKRWDTSVIRNAVCLQIQAVMLGSVVDTRACPFPVESPLSTI